MNRKGKEKPCKKERKRYKKESLQAKAAAYR